MTDEYTPTTEEVRDGYVHDPEAEYYDPEGYPFAVAGAKRAFDRWLAAHDAEVAAKALGGDEQEFVVRSRAVSTGNTFETITDEETARFIMADPVDGIERTLYRRRKAGPWVIAEGASS